MTGDLVPLEVLSGVEPSTDRPTASTRHYTFSDKIRFKDGFPEKIGGWVSFEFNGNNTIDGAPRSIFSYVLDGIVRYLVGTNTRLYDVFGSALTNVTPLKDTTVAVPNSLDTYYISLASNPITTVSGSTTITIADTATKVREGDTITLSGSAAVNGIPASEINTTHFVRSQDTNSFTVIVATSATSGGNGGGGSIVLATGTITVNSTAHGLLFGDRVGLSGAADTGGIVAADINIEHIIRNIQTNSFDISTAGTATSSVSGGGGASTEYQEPIDAGQADTLSASGYGAGLYGVGLYGVGKTSSNSVSARLWSHDRFGNLTVSTAGQQTGVYQWDGDTLTAPVLVANAPEAVNYVFVTNSIVVTLGASDEENRLQWSDQGGISEWVSGQARTRNIAGAGKFLTHATARGENLLFTLNQTYIFRYIGGQFVFQTTLLDGNVGCIAQNARASASGVVYWMGLTNFYMWRGGNVEVIPSNSSTESTVLRYVFENLNNGQKEKIFAWFNSEFREVWFHYPSANSNNPNRVAKVNIDTFEWSIDTFDRSCAEYPSILTQNPYLIDMNGGLYLHENGVNDDQIGMNWQLTTNRIYGGSDTVQHKAIVPEYQNLTGNVNVNLTARDYPQSIDKSSKDYVLASSTDRIATEQNGRFWQYDLTGSDLDQELELGLWYQEIERSSKK